MSVADLDTNPRIPTTVGDLQIPSWETAAAQAPRIAPHLSSPYSADVMPVPSSGGFRQTFPEYAVLDPNILSRGLDALAKAPDIGFGAIDSVLGHVPSRVAGAVGSAVAPVIPQPVKDAGDAAARKFDELANAGIEAWTRRIGNVFKPDTTHERSLLGEGDKLTFFGGEDLAQDATDAAKMVATALVLIKGPGVLSRALSAARLGAVADLAGGYSSSFADTFRGQTFANAIRGASTVRTAETTAQVAGRLAGLATQAVAGTGLVAEAVLPHIAGDEKWAQDILNTRVVPEDSPWRFPFEIATTIPLDLPSWLASARDARVTAKAAERVFGPGRNPSTFVFPHAQTAVDNGLWSQSELDAFNTHSVKQYAKQTLLDDWKNTSGATATEVGQLPQVALEAKRLGVSEQDAANKLISDRIADLYREHGTDGLHRLASSHAMDRFNWQGLDEASRIEQWREYYNTALPFERDNPGLILGVNETNQMVQRDQALAWLQEQDRFGSAERARFEANFSSFNTDGENWARRLSKDELITKLEGIDVPAGTTMSDAARIGGLRARLEKTNAAILAGDKTLRSERAALLGEIKTVRESAVDYYLKQADVIEAKIASREAEMYGLSEAQFSDRIATDYEYDHLQQALSEARIAARDAQLAGTRWELQRFRDGTARMRLTDDLGVRVLTKERTAAGKVWDRLFGALPNRTLALKAENFLYEQAGKAGYEPGKVDRFMALASDQLDLANKESLFGFRRTKYASIYNLEPSVIDSLAAKAGLTDVPAGMKSWAEVMYRAYPGPLRILQEAVTGGRSVKVPYNRTLTLIARTMYPQLRFYFSPRFIAVNLQERNILGSAFGGRAYKTAAEDPRLTRLAEGLDRYQTAANTSFVEIDALPKELGQLTGLMSPTYMARNFVEALRKDPTMVPALRSAGVNPDSIADVTKYLNDVLQERMKLAKFDVPLTQAEQATKARIDELTAKQSTNMGLDLADRKELEQLNRELLASVVKRHVRQEGAIINKASRDATANPGTATNENLARAQGRTFAPKTGAALSLSADEVAKAYENAKQAFLDAKTNGGVTRSIRGETPTSGFAVSPYKGRETVIDGRPATQEDYRVFTRKNLDVLSQPDHFIGGWTDQTTGKSYLDVSVVKSSREDAIRLAQESDQLAIYDIAGGADIRVPRRAEAANGPASADDGTNGTSGGEVSQGLPTDEARAAVTQALLNSLSRANFRALDDARAIFLGNPERSALERGLNSYLLYWPVSYQLKVGAAMFKFLTGKAFNLPTGSAPAIVWNKLYTDVQDHIAKKDDVGQWFTDHKEALFLLQQMLPTTPDSFGATLSPFTRLAGAVVGLGQDPDPKKLYDRVTQQGPTYDFSLFWRVAQETAKNLKAGGS